MTLYEYLRTHDLTPTAFAARVGVEPITVSRWIRGERFPRPDMIHRIAVATDGAVQPGDFFQTPPNLRPEVIGA